MGQCRHVSPSDQGRAQYRTYYRGEPRIISAETGYDHVYTAEKKGALNSNYGKVCVQEGEPKPPVKLYTVKVANIKATSDDYKCDKDV
jgi:hypothetical protein